MDTKKEASTVNATAPNVSEKAKDKSFGKAEFWKNLFFGLLYATGGYILGGTLLPFHARPFGIAFLGASNRRVPYIYAGLCLGAWFSSERWLLIGIYSAMFLIRLLVRFTLDTPWSKEEKQNVGEKTLTDIYPYLFSEATGLRMATACIGAFALGIYRLAEGGFLYYDLYGTLLSIIIAPAAVLLLSGFFHDTYTHPYPRLCGILTLSFLLIFSLRSQVLYGVSLSVLGCMLVTLTTTRKEGVMLGTLAGTVCGLAVAPSLAPLFAFGALAFGLFQSVSKTLAIIFSFSAAMAWGIYVQGIGILGGLLGGTLSAFFLFSVLDSVFFVKKQAETTQEKTETAEAEAIPCQPLQKSAMNAIQLSDTNRTVKNLCESFVSLSDLFTGLGRRMQMPTAADLRQICDNAFDASCVSCSLRSDCWGQHYHDTASEIGTICTALHRKDRVDLPDVANTLSDRCSRLPDILEEINHNAALHKKQILQNDRTEIFASDYKALADLLSDAMAKQDDEYEIDAACSEALCHALTDLNIGIEGAVVWGKKRRRIKLIASDRRMLLQETERLTQIIRSVCSFPITEAQWVDTDETSIEFWEAERLSVVYAQRTICADGEEEYCGDTTALFRVLDGRFCAMISDGMGSGQEAAVTSGISTLFLRKLLSSGSACSTALEMLNCFLRNRGGGSLHECSATVDLMELDLLRSHASFYKCGAAPTYVFRDGSLFKIRSHTVPIGIIEKPDTRKLGFDVNVGDVLVMVSDGVTQGKEECPWLFDLLRTQSERCDPERLADLIVKYAKGEECSDDISVLVIKLKSA